MDSKRPAARPAIVMGKEERAKISEATLKMKEMSGKTEGLMYLIGLCNSSYRKRFGVEQLTESHSESFGGFVEEVFRMIVDGEKDEACKLLFVEESQ